MSASHLIPQINTPTDTTFDYTSINNQFKDFYSSLYTSEQSPDPSLYSAFFRSLDIPIIDPEQVSELEEPFTAEEIILALRSMQSRKCPGPDGFPVEFYKAFSEKLTPLLLNMYNESFESGLLPITLRQASISLILKKDKDPLQCGSYRPISLLGNYVKLLAKVLARRLEATLPSIISIDQTGFIRNRSSYYNIRRLFNVLYNPSSSKVPELILSLDAEKAFDRVEWGYLFETLRRFGFGEKFLTWTRLLYTLPEACVRTNNNYSDYFPLGRGTRQGCPLSPLLFAIAVEPLAIALRTSAFPGIMRGGVEQKVSLYADDLLLYVSDPDKSIPLVLTILGHFGQISGYKLNLSKSELMPVNSAAKTYALSRLPFKISRHKLTYLGICVTNRFDNLFKDNFSPLLDRLTHDFQRWSLLPLSLAGRINCIKMNVLPRWLYLLQCIPIFIAKSFFRKLDGRILQFIWERRNPRIRKQVLQRPKLSGGMALPNFQQYFWAANLRSILHWQNVDSIDPIPAWLCIESASCAPASLSALLCSPSLSLPPKFTKNIIVKHSLKIWHQFTRHYKLNTPSLSTPLHANPLFPPSLLDKAYALWHSQGISTISSLYVDGIFASFNELVDIYDLPRTNFFRYLQVRDFVRKHFSGFPVIPPISPIDLLLKQDPIGKGAITRLCNEIAMLQSPDSCTLRTIWSQDLGEDIDCKTWEAILYRVHHSSICARHGVLQCKVVHRIHWSRCKLAKIFPDIDPTCERCRQAPADLCHMFWLCPSLASFWESVFDTLSKVTSIPITPSPIAALFGVLPAESPLPKYLLAFVAFLTLLARRLILMTWKGPYVPTHSRWIGDVLHFMQLEKIKHTLRGSLPKFDTIWQPFSEYIDGIQIIPPPSD